MPSVSGFTKDEWSKLTESIPPSDIAGEEYFSLKQLIQKRYSQLNNVNTNEYTRKFAKVFLDTMRIELGEERFNTLLVLEN